MTRSGLTARNGTTALDLELGLLPYHPHAQLFADTGQKKGGGKIHDSRRLLDVGNHRGSLDGDNVAVLVWVSECRHALNDSS